ncbi:MAG: PKD domain-containing protein, partial [Flavobacteriales bacterium]
MGHYGCYDTVYYDSVVYVNGPIVSYSTFLNCDSAEYRTFTAQTWKGVQRFYWDFGDGTPFDSVHLSPTHYYDSTGTYVPKLMVYNDSAGCAATLATQVFVNHLVSKFTSNNFGANPVDTIACLPSLFEFDADSSEGEFGSYLWIYDGIDTGSYTIKDQYFFTTSGFHDVALTVHDINNCHKTFHKEVFISGPVAYFDFDYSGNCDPVEIEFEDVSQIDTTVVSWDWNFGDSTSHSSLQDPNHEFFNEGTFSVKLSIEDTFGCTSHITRPVIVKLPIVAYLVDTIACEKEYSYFQNLSIGDSLTYFWYFDNGSTST